MSTPRKHCFCYQICTTLYQSAALLPSPLVHRMVEGLRHVAMHDECTVCCLRVNV